MFTVDIEFVGADCEVLGHLPHNYDDFESAVKDYAVNDASAWLVYGRNRYNGCNSVVVSLSEGYKEITCKYAKLCMGRTDYYPRFLDDDMLEIYKKYIKSLKLDTLGFLYYN